MIISLGAVFWLHLCWVGVLFLACCSFWISGEWDGCVLPHRKFSVDLIVAASCGSRKLCFSLWELILMAGDSLRT